MQLPVYHKYFMIKVGGTGEAQPASTRDYSTQKIKIAIKAINKVMTSAGSVENTHTAIVGKTTTSLSAKSFLFKKMGEIFTTRTPASIVRKRTSTSGMKKLVGKTVSFIQKKGTKNTTGGGTTGTGGTY